jgi:hypothetical protein
LLTRGNILFISFRETKRSHTEQLLPNKGDILKKIIGKLR